MFSIMAKMDEGWLLLVSDVGYSKESWTQMILPGLTTNKFYARQSLEWVRDFSSREDCIQAIANHDPTIKPQIIE